MKWSNIRLIFLREFRDQLRDRRTLFTIAVLPLLLYPLLGMSIFQVAQFMREHPTRVWIVSDGPLPDDPPLFDRETQAFANGLCSPADAALLKLEIADSFPDELRREGVRQVARQKIEDGTYDAVIYLPPQFADSLAALRSELLRRSTARAPAAANEPGANGESGEPAADAESIDSLGTLIPSPEIVTNEANDKSQIAGARVQAVLNKWRDSIVEQNLIRNRIPIAATRPFHVVSTDVAAEETRRAAVWSKILPFVVLIWALTGAFYPAIDLCAGEKERGTLETLLSSPAQRSEIVWGKLLTIMAFSMATSLLNLLSMGATGAFIIGLMERLGGGAQLAIGSPPWTALAWLLPALIPISALFSALSLAIAAFARSSKEGQYYLMPLLLITLPLMMLALLPAAELDWGTSLIPVTGMMMLLQALVEGRYVEAAQFALPVLAVTGVCCLLAIRWAIDQFNNESVLFRENEPFGLGLWLRHLFRDRGATPSLSEAILCGVILLVIRFFANFLVPASTDWGGIATTTVVSQLALIATPAVLMAILLTRSPRRTLLLNRPRLITIPAAILLAIALNPLVHVLGGLIQYLYPMSPETLKGLESLTEGIRTAPVWQVLLVIAVMPALCEELAFRGFILSGLRHTGHKWTAIAVSAVFFGVAHGILQQSIVACGIGLVIGYIAVQTGSLVPCVLFHLTSNSLAVLSSRIQAETIAQYPVLGYIFQEAGEGQYTYNIAVTVAGGVLSLLVLWWFRSLPYERYAEERRQEALDHQRVGATCR